MKRKFKNLPLADKLDLLNKCKVGRYIRYICNEYPAQVFIIIYLLFCIMSRII